MLRYAAQKCNLQMGVQADEGMAHNAEDRARRLSRD